jgi:hypothetical protein
LEILGHAPTTDSPIGLLDGYVNCLYADWKAVEQLKL